jgi:hypothetical protein
MDIFTAEGGKLLTPLSEQQSNISNSHHKIWKQNFDNTIYIVSTIMGSGSLYRLIGAATRLQTGHEIVVRFPVEARESRPSLRATHPLTDGCRVFLSPDLTRSEHDVDHHRY